MERKGSGLTKIIEVYKAAYNYSEEKEPQFLSSRVEFTMTLKNLNYDVKVGINDVNSNVKNNVVSDSDRYDIVLNIIRENTNVTQSEMAGKLVVSIRTAQRTLDKMVKNGKYVG